MYVERWQRSVVIIETIHFRPPLSSAAGYFLMRGRNPLMIGGIPIAQTFYS
jgi:hypothetical protein